MSFRQEVLILLSFTYFVVNNASNACTGVVGTRWQPDGSDCSFFHICHGRRGIKLPCPWNTVTNAELEACVPRGSKMDTCTTRQSQIIGRSTTPPYLTRPTFRRTKKTTSTPSSPRPTITSRTSVPHIPVSIPLGPDTTVKVTTQRKTPPSTMTSTQNMQTHKWVTVPPQNIGGKSICTQRSGEIILIPENCAKFINCSGGSEFKIEECPSPLLFDQVRRQCTDPGRAVCGGRLVPTNSCRSGANCQSGLPTCRGRPNGFNPWRNNLISSSFVICANQRVVYKGTCPSDITVTVFDPARRMCTELNVNAGRFN